MGKETDISWCDATVNFWHGCLKVSEGCKFCYMYREKQGRFGHDASIVTRGSKQKFNEALRWKEPLKIFTCSWSDFFIKQADPWRADAWDIIRKTPHHTWIILTKRPERILSCLPPDWGDGYPNVWIGISAENQKKLHTRIMHLYNVPCKVRFLSLEPLLSKVDILPYLKVKIQGTETWIKPIHWVIAGGESGNDNGPYKYRHCKTEWINDIVKACKEHNVPMWVKQLGTGAAKMLGLKSREGNDITDLNFPDYLRVQQFPVISLAKNIKKSRAKNEKIPPPAPIKTGD